MKDKEPDEENPEPSQLQEELNPWEVRPLKVDDEKEEIVCGSNPFYELSEKEPVPNPRHGRAHHFDQHNSVNCVKFNLAASIYEQIHYESATRLGGAINLSQESITEKLLSVE